MRNAVMSHVLLRRIGATLAASAVLALPARSQWVTTYETFYLQAPHNWTFRNNYQNADRLFNAFDYGHAILYETLFTKPGAPAALLEERIYDRLTTKILVRPPKVPLEEVAIEPMYARLSPEAKAMFDWSHILHRQIYDVLADERMTDAQKDAEVQRLLAYYKTRPDLAFSSKPKSMALMQEQAYSLAFRQKYPKFNGLIWGYHWFQVGLYEPLLVGTSGAERQAGVRATVARFWQMLRDPMTSLPYQMPMTAAIAPTFARRFPEAAIIFDNLHSMHDVVSDILTNPSVPRDRKRAEIVRAGQLFRDDTSYVMSEAAWRVMAQEMGVENMGGAATGFTPALPTPTVTRGAVMVHDNASGRMTGMKVGRMVGGAHAGMDHGAPADSATSHKGMDHGTPADSVTPHEGGAADPMHAMHHPEVAASVTRVLELQRALLRDPVIRRRVVADPALRQLMLGSLEGLSAVDRAELLRLLSVRTPPTRR